MSRLRIFEWEERTDEQTERQTESRETPYNFHHYEILCYNLLKFVFQKFQG